MNLGLGLGLTRRGGGGGFDPASLFATGEVGAWYDPSDLSTMFQDTTGTTPVTATGQSVARINDKSGNAKHATQGTAANCPVLRQTAGGKYYLDFDGTNDSLECAALILAQPITLTASALIENAAGSFGNIYDGRSNASHRVIVGSSNANDYRIYAGAVVAGGTRDASAHVLHAFVSGASSTLQIDSEAAITGNPGTQGLGSGLRIGADHLGTGQLFDGRYHGGIVLNRALTSAEAADVRTYLGGKA